MLEVKNLTFKVEENGVKRSIVKDVSFQVEDGEMLVITGPNGGGKSSLAKVLMGIAKEDSGQIMEKTLLLTISIIEQMRESDLHFNSRRDLKG